MNMWDFQRQAGPGSITPALGKPGRLQVGSKEETAVSELLLQWRSSKPISPGMKHDSVSKDLTETSLSASLLTELFRFICGTNGEK